MNKSDLITLLKSADCGSDELNVAYYEWKYSDRVVDFNKYVKVAGKRKPDGGLDLIYLHDVSNSVDAALGEIQSEYDIVQINRQGGEHSVFLSIREKNASGDHKSLPIAILLAVVEAAV
jgi:hypothetical protein